MGVPAAMTVAAERNPSRQALSPLGASVSRQLSPRRRVISCRSAQVVERISKLADSGLNTYVTDAQRGFTIILTAGLGAALLFCLVYMILLRFCAGIMAWAVILLVNVLFVAITLIAAYKSGLLSTIPGTDSLSTLMEATGETLTGTRHMGTWLHLGLLSCSAKRTQEIRIAWLAAGPHRD
jgi:hypothetical protein